jgi:hypothetical protein
MTGVDLVQLIFAIYFNGSEFKFYLSYQPTVGGSKSLLLGAFPQRN